jgi:hypothetical protein
VALTCGSPTTTKEIIIKAGTTEIITAVAIMEIRVIKTTVTRMSNKDSINSKAPIR